MLVGMAEEMLVEILVEMLVEILVKMSVGMAEEMWTYFALGDVETREKTSHTGSRSASAKQPIVRTTAEPTVFSTISTR